MQQKYFNTLSIERDMKWEGDDLTTTFLISQKMVIYLFQRKSKKTDGMPF